MKTLGSLFAAAGIALFGAAAQAQPADMAAGEAAFAAQCGRCHQVSRMQSYMARRPDDATRRADLDAFLTRHHAPNEQTRQAIIAWLLSQQKPAP